jgi:DNA polymerase III subunit epsilon
MHALFYDTETTGLPLFNEPSEDPRQPHIVQLGAALVNLDTFDQVASLDLIVRPDGWTVPDDVAAIHGITTEHAMDVGVSAEMVIHMLMELWGCADVRIGHNEGFDARMVRIALMRHASTADADAWKAGAAECTQGLSTPILKLPPTAKMVAAKRNHHKSANLGEAYQFFTGKPLEGAHRAMVDVQACIEVYRAIKAGVREAVAA